MIKSLLIAASVLTFSMSVADAHDTKGEHVQIVFDQKLPNVPGKSMKAALVEYAPGGVSAPHTHAQSAFIYATVLEGAITSQVNDGPEKTYHAGESFFEAPGDHHTKSVNASKTEAAKLLAVFVVDTDDTNLTTPDK